MGFQPWFVDSETGQTVDQELRVLNTNNDGLLVYSWHHQTRRRHGPFLLEYGQAWARLLVVTEGRSFGYRAACKRRNKRYSDEIFCVDASGAVQWSVPVPKSVRFESMVLAAEDLILAGSDRSANHEAVLWVLNAQDGAKRAEMPLGVRPSAEGLAVAYGKLYMSTRDGRMTCWGRP